MIEESDGDLKAYEFKISSKKAVSIPKSFTELYPGVQLIVLNPDNFIGNLEKEYKV